MGLLEVLISENDRAVHNRRIDSNRWIVSQSPVVVIRCAILVNLTIVLSAIEQATSPPSMAQTLEKHRTNLD